VPFSTEESIYLNCLGILGSGLPCVNPDGSVPLLTPILTGGAVDVLPYQSSFSNFGENEIFSVFADGTWRLSERLEATVGVRYVTEDRSSGFSALSPLANLAPIPLLRSSIPVARSWRPAAISTTGCHDSICCIRSMTPSTPTQRYPRADAPMSST
jgi:outer membrane receptor protein involved in Fe transport